MLDFITEEIVKSSVGIATKILGDRIEQKNQELFEKKKNDRLAQKRHDEKEKKELKEEEISALILTDDEIETIKLSKDGFLQGDLNCSEAKTLSNLREHVKKAKRWCDQISFRDASGEKSLSEVYIHLNIYLMPQRRHFDASEKADPPKLLETMIGEKGHILIEGQPGAGKSTSMKKLFISFFEQKPDQFPANRHNFPILIRFRELNSTNDTIFGKLRKLLAYDIKVVDAGAKSRCESLERQWEEETLLPILEELNPIIILDGFDEFTTQDQKKLAVSQIRKIARSLQKAKLVVTCRTGEFNYSIDHMNVFEIAPLDTMQIQEFATNWIGEDADTFLSQVNSSPFADTATKPLSLAHLCAIYERTKKIPERPKTVYRKVVMLLLEEWDEQRSVKRMEKLFNGFGPDRMADFLSHLSYVLTTSTQVSNFSREQMKEAYCVVCSNFGLLEEDCDAATIELESNTGLFLQTGSEQYEFLHKSLQEYLAADYIVKLPNTEHIRGNIENLAVELAIAIAISANPSLYFSDIVLRFFINHRLSPSFYIAFIIRLKQEKPDFYPTGDITVATISLIDEIQSLGVENHASLSALEWILEQCNIQAVKAFYRVASVAPSVRLSLFNKSEKFNLKSNITIPEGHFSEIIGKEL